MRRKGFWAWLADKTIFREWDGDEKIMLLLLFGIIWTLGGWIPMILIFGNWWITCLGGPILGILCLLYVKYLFDEE